MREDALGLWPAMWWWIDSKLWNVAFDGSWIGDCVTCLSELSLQRCQGKGTKYVTAFGQNVGCLSVSLVLPKGGDIL